MTTTQPKKKTLSEAAQVAKLAKAFCAKLGVKASAKSSNYSMGNSVRVKVEDLPPALFEKIERHLSKYQYGKFNGMDDCYEYTNKQEDIPQTKHLFVENEFSDEIRQDAYSFLQALCPNNVEGCPALVEDAYMFEFLGEPMDRSVYRVLRGSFQIEGACDEFWKSRKKTSQPKEAVTVQGGSSISKHTHTKKGFDMWIIQLDGRATKEEFKALLDVAKAQGGWYSRKWGETPAGFAFKSEGEAKIFSDNLKNGTKTGSPLVSTGVSPDKLRELADKMQSDIDSKFADRETNTPRKLKFAQSARNEGIHMERAQDLLNKLADLIESDSLPAELEGVKTKKKALELTESKKKMADNGYHSYYQDTGEPREDTEETRAAWSILEGKGRDGQEMELETLLNQVKFSKIAGYFPTPKSVIDRMIYEADLKEGARVLEPSAGHGAIADALKEAGHTVECCEVNPTLRKILGLKGLSLIGDDFMELKEGGFDSVVMNPPFERLQDIDHVKHAWSLIKEGGTLVSIMSGSFAYRQDSKSTGFRDWIENQGGTWESLPDGSFKESGTNVNSVILTLIKS